MAAFFVNMQDNATFTDVLIDLPVAMKNKYAPFVNGIVCLVLFILTFIPPYWIFSMFSGTITMRLSFYSIIKDTLPLVTKNGYLFESVLTCAVALLSLAVFVTGIYAVVRNRGFKLAGILCFLIWLLNLTGIIVNAGGALSEVSKHAIKPGPGFFLLLLTGAAYILLPKLTTVRSVRENNK